MWGAREIRWETKGPQARDLDEIEFARDAFAGKDVPTAERCEFPVDVSATHDLLGLDQMAGNLDEGTAGDLVPCGKHVSVAVIRDNLDALNCCPVDRFGFASVLQLVQGLTRLELPLSAGSKLGLDRG